MAFENTLLNSSKFDIRNLPQGVYIVNFYCIFDDQNQIYKIIIN